jgi:CTP synthase
MTKFVFVTGGVLSGIGKGVTTASIGKILEFRGHSVDVVKIDPYLNVDPGTLNPVEHGEVFVAEEVYKFIPAKDFEFKICELDQDFGHYERFLNKNIHPRNNITSGQIYLSVILQERYGAYLGKTIQIIPHITETIQKRLIEIAEASKPDVLLVEVGGTVGDIESAPFLETIRLFRLNRPTDEISLVHVTLVPHLKTIGEFKTKPTQHSVKGLQQAGLQPDLIVCRSTTELPTKVKEKVALFTNVKVHSVFTNPDVPQIIQIPFILDNQGLGDQLCTKLGISKAITDKAKVKSWNDAVTRFKVSEKCTRLALLGKYTDIHDSYISINKALVDAGAWIGCKTEIEWVDSEKVESKGFPLDKLQEYHGILMTPGFGSRGTEGMINACTFAREQKIPFLGICFGAQLATVAFARSVMGWKNANSTEIDPDTPYPVVDLLPTQVALELMGGTMRLGGHKITLKPNTKIQKAYNKEKIVERFRHRYHIITEYAQKMEEKGFVVSAVDESGKIINAIEVSDHPFYTGVQCHPEYKSRPEQPSPIYIAFMEAAMNHDSKKSD